MFEGRGTAVEVVVAVAAVANNYVTGLLVASTHLPISFPERTNKQKGEQRMTIRKEAKIEDQEKKHTQTTKGGASAELTE